VVALRARIIRCGLVVAAALWTPAVIAAQSIEPARVVASIGDFVVHEADLDAWWQTHEAVSYARARQDWYDGRRKALDAILGDYLLQRAAASRNLTVEALLAEELPRRSASVNGDDIRRMYERSLPLPGGMTFDQVKPMITSYLEQQHLLEARSRFVEDLRAAARATIHLDPPRQPVAIADNNPATGSSSAALEIVEFSDFECPYCRQLEPVLAQLRAKYGEQVRFVWKDFPLPIHSHARGAAEAARCAADQMRFWEYHDLLFASQQALAPGDLRRHARTAGLDVDRFAKCLEAGTHQAGIAADLEEGMRQGVEATPTVFINGRAVVGAQPIDAYEKVIEEELSR
jgi:protein-disulfide isomerase